MRNDMAGNDIDPTPPDADSEQRRIDAIVEKGPSGTFAVAGVATAIVIAIWFAFYFFAYLPRGAVQ
jgi:hypothetical protein